MCTVSVLKGMPYSHCISSIHMRTCTYWHNSHTHTQPWQTVWWWRYLLPQVHDGGAPEREDQPHHADEGCGGWAGGLEQCSGVRFTYQIYLNALCCYTMLLPYINDTGGGAGGLDRCGCRPWTNYCTYDTAVGQSANLDVNMGIAEWRVDSQANITHKKQEKMIYWEPWFKRYLIFLISPHMRKRLAVLMIKVCLRIPIQLIYLHNAGASDVCNPHRYALQLGYFT